MELVVETLEAVPCVDVTLGFVTLMVMGVVLDVVMGCDALDFGVDGVGWCDDHG